MTTNLQISALSDSGDTAPASRRARPAKVLSHPAKRVGGSSTGKGSLHPVGVAVGPFAAGSRTGDEESAGDSMTTPTDDVRRSTSVLMEGVSPRQVAAARMLIEGRLGKDVAVAIGVSPETISRWRHRPEFEALMRELLQDTVDATKLGLVSLCAESIVHLRGLVRSFDDQTSLKAITLILGKVGPVLGIIGGELRQAPAPDSR